MTVGTATIHELDTVELLIDLPEARLEYSEMDDAPLHAGDRGIVVFAYTDGRSFTVEFFRRGETVAIADVTEQQIRRIDAPSEKAVGMHFEFAFLAKSARFLPNQHPRFNVVGGAFGVPRLPTCPRIPRL